MGLNVCLELNGNDHPDWDSGRQQNDKDFPSLLEGLKSPDHPEAKGFCFGQEITGYEYHMRPESMRELRQRIEKAGWECKERYLHLCDLLEADENCWLYISY